PAPIRELAARLDDLSVTVAKSARFEDLRDTLRAAWRLRPENFLDLKAATDTPERRDTLHAQIAAAFAPIARNGVVGPGTLPPNEESSRTVSIRLKEEPRSQARPVPRDRVVPERMIRHDGPVYRESCAAFTSPRIGPILFSLIADRLDRTPTLTYE